MPDKRGTVLIIEDEPDIALLEQMQLERAGFSVLIAGKPDEALELLRGQPINLVLLDYRLPGDVDGLEFHVQMREAGFDLPVILVTGFSNEALAIRALRAGVRDFITKSLEYLDYLPEAVSRVLRQVHTEYRLAETEARLTSIIDSAKDAIIITDGDHRITLFNRAAEVMFRCPASIAMDQPATGFIAREFLPLPGVEDEEPHLPTGELTHLIQFGNRGVRSDGTDFPLEASLSQTTVEGRRIYTLVVRDITRRKKAEAELRESEERFRQIVNSAMDGIITVDEDQRVIRINAAAESMFGCRGEEVLGQPMDRFIPTRFRAGHFDHVREFGTTGVAARAMGGFGPISGLRANNEEFPIEASISQILVDGRKLFTVTCRDVTERVRAAQTKQKLEAQLIQSQKMEAFGQLAGGIAHDFNNLLTIISGYSEILLMILPVDDPNRQSVMAIGEAGSRAASLTNQLLAFSRQAVLEPKVLDINVEIRETEKILRRLIGEDIFLTTLLDPSIRQVKVDPGLLGQVLMNLAVNARDAMPRGGKITIETGNVELDCNFSHPSSDFRPGSFVLMALSDTGSGMTAEIQARIFEPFFTTKGVGKGTGLGLAVVHGIVKQSGAQIKVESDLGRGTTFKIYFPAVVGPLSNRAGAESGKDLRGKETILLVEDEENVRGLVSLALRSYGYQLLIAENGKDALKLLQSYTGGIDLLLTDVVMPYLGGRELADILQQRFPLMKVIFMSGYTDDAVVRHGLLQDKVPFLQKPTTPLKLAGKVRSVLDSG